MDLTNFQQIEAALGDSENRYRTLADAVPQLMWINDAAGNTQFFNQRWLEYTGIPSELSLKIWPESLHPEDAPFVVARKHQAIATGEGYEIECRLKQFDQTYRWHLIRVMPLKDEQGQVTAWFGTATDVDDRRRSEQTQQFLAQASATFAAASFDLQSVLNQATQLISEFIGDLCVLSLLSADKRWLETVALAHPNPQAQTLTAHLLQQYPRSSDTGIAGSVIQTGEAAFVPIVEPEQFRNGLQPEYRAYLEQFGVSSLLIVPLKVQGRVIGTLGMSRDRQGTAYTLNDQRLLQELADRAAMAIANAQLYQEAQQARQVAELAATRTSQLQQVTAALSEALTPKQVARVVVEQGIAALGGQAGVVVLLVEQGQSLEPLEAVGYAEDIISAWQRFPVTAPVPIAEAVQTQTPIFLENPVVVCARYPLISESLTITGHHALASIPLIVEGRILGALGISFREAQPFTADDRAFILTLGQQCAQAIARAQLYEAEKSARAEAETANRIKDEFLAVLSHELRSPLNPILGWARLLRTRKFDELVTQQALETIERNAKLQTQLIEDLLDVSRILRGKLSLNVVPVNLAKIVEASLETVRLAAEAKNIQIHSILDAQVSLIAGDAARLQQIVWNLLANAIKFTPNGGLVEVRLDCIDNQAQIQITDMGKGISPQFLPYVFESFCQEDSKTTRQFGGLGLGLAIVRHLTELHGGTVTAASPGEDLGATFTVKLPLLTSSDATPTQPQEAHQFFDLTGLKVLAVDDEVDSQALVSFTLQQAGATVSTANSVATALNLIQQTLPDVLVCDIGMPEMDGYMLLKQLRSHSPERGGQIPAIALTAYAGETNERLALAAGFQLHLSKPVEPEKLVQAIASLTGRSDRSYPEPVEP